MAAMTKTNDAAKPALGAGEATSTSFADLGLSSWLTGTLESLSIYAPSEIQRACIPEILKGRNVVGNAKTGSGKTAAFALPILQKLSEEPYGPFALVLTPTRELAFQIAEQFRVLGVGINVREAVIVGGMDMMAQTLELEKRPHIIIATPGRLADQINSTGNSFQLNKASFLVLDEADRLLDPTFAEDLETVFGKLRKDRQTLLFSATMTKSIETLIAQSKEDNGSSKQLKDLFVHRNSGKYDPVDRLDQRYVFVPSAVREAYFIHLVRNDFKDKTMIIFTGRCRTCALLLALLQNFGVRSTALHSFMTQSERVASLAKFKSNVVPVLLATDVGSRGLDIPTVQLVINFDIPACATDYIHRVGRTARAGRGGMSVSIVTERDVDVVHNIETKMSKKLLPYKVDEEAVNQSEFLNEVSVGKREALMHLEDTGFGTKKEINLKKQKEQQALAEGDGDQTTRRKRPQSGEGSQKSKRRLK
ncbi:putative RNA helicase [Sorochytrium milnesiophthora]